MFKEWRHRRAVQRVQPQRALRLRYNWLLDGAAG